ncbi:hypothetical protein [Lacticaseibacillus salsurivasis]|uniref:hypothetical protein n=1 Tax=Lacticaseibacillus salsurivasis TaxID=3081441 RepID=UPI0030C772D9
MKQVVVGLGAVLALLMIGMVPLSAMIAVQLGVLSWLGYAWRVAFWYMVVANVAAFALGLFTDGLSETLMRLQPTWGRQQLVMLGLNAAVYAAVAWGFQLQLTASLIWLLAAEGTLVAWVIELGMTKITGEAEV